MTWTITYTKYGKVVIYAVWKHIDQCELHKEYG